MLTPGAAIEDEPLAMVSDVPGAWYIVGPISVWVTDRDPRGDKLGHIITGNRAAQRYSNPDFVDPPASRSETAQAAGDPAGIAVAESASGAEHSQSQAEGRGRCRFVTGATSALQLREGVRFACLANRRRSLDGLLDDGSSFGSLIASRFFSPITNRPSIWWECSAAPLGYGMREDERSRSRELRPGRQARAPARCSSHSGRSRLGMGRVSGPWIDYGDRGYTIHVW